MSIDCSKITIELFSDWSVSSDFGNSVRLELNKRSPDNWSVELDSSSSSWWVNNPVLPTRVTRAVTSFERIYWLSWNSNVTTRNPISETNDFAEGKRKSLRANLTVFGVVHRRQEYCLCTGLQVSVFPSAPDKWCFSTQPHTNILGLMTTVLQWNYYSQAAFRILWWPYI